MFNDVVMPFYFARRLLFSLQRVKRTLDVTDINFPHYFGFEEKLCTQVSVAQLFYKYRKCADMALPLDEKFISTPAGINAKDTIPALVSITHIASDAPVL